MFLQLYMDQPEQDERNNEKDRLLYKKQSNSFWQLKCLQCIPTRYTIVLVTFLGFVNVYALRVNLSMAIVAMVNNSAVNNPGNSSSHKSHLVRPSLFENPFSLVTLIIPMVTSNMTGAQHNKVLCMSVLNLVLIHHSLLINIVIIISIRKHSWRPRNT